MRAHQDRRGGARAWPRRTRCIDLRLSLDLHAIHAERVGRHRDVHQSRRRERDGRWRLSRRLRGRAQHRAQGARHRVRRLHLFRSHPQHRGRLRLPPPRLRRAQLHLRPQGMVEPVSLERAARPLARAFSGRAARIDEAACRPEALQARLQGFLPRASRSTSSAAISTPCISASRKNSASAAPSSPAMPPM